MNHTTTERTTEAAETPETEMVFGVSREQIANRRGGWPLRKGLSDLAVAVLVQVEELEDFDLCLLTRLVSAAIDQDLSLEELADGLDELGRADHIWLRRGATSGEFGICLVNPPEEGHDASPSLAIELVLKAQKAASARKTLIREGSPFVARFADAAEREVVLSVFRLHQDHTAAAVAVLSLIHEMIRMEHVGWLELWHEAQRREMTYGEFSRGLRELDANELIDLRRCDVTGRMVLTTMEAVNVSFEHIEDACEQLLTDKRARLPALTLSRTFRHHGHDLTDNEATVLDVAQGLRKDFHKRKLLSVPILKRACGTFGGLSGRDVTEALRGLQERGFIEIEFNRANHKLMRLAVEVRSMAEEGRREIGEIMGTIEPRQRTEEGAECASPSQGVDETPTPSELSAPCGPQLFTPEPVVARSWAAPLSKAAAVVGMLAFWR